MSGQRILLHLTGIHLVALCATLVLFLFVDSSAETIAASLPQLAGPVAGFVLVFLLLDIRFLRYIRIRHTRSSPVSFQPEQLIWDYHDLLKRRQWRESYCCFGNRFRSERRVFGKLQPVSLHDHISSYEVIEFQGIDSLETILIGCESGSALVYARYNQQQTPATQPVSRLYHLTHEEAKWRINVAYADLRSHQDLLNTSRWVIDDDIADGPWTHVGVFTALAILTAVLTFRWPGSTAILSTLLSSTPFGPLGFSLGGAVAAFILTFLLLETSYRLALRYRNSGRFRRSASPGDQGAANVVPFEIIVRTAGPEDCLRRFDDALHRGMHLTAYDLLSEGYLLRSPTPQVRWLFGSNIINEEEITYRAFKSLVKSTQPRVEPLAFSPSQQDGEGQGTAVVGYVVNGVRQSCQVEVGFRRDGEVWRITGIQSK